MMNHLKEDEKSKLSSSRYAPKYVPPFNQIMFIKCCKINKMSIITFKLKDRLHYNCYQLIRAIT